MSGSRLSTWLLMGMVVVGIYVLPSVTARFAGPHTMEYNASGQMSALRCGACHGYIRDEINATPLADSVMDRHINALLSSDYANASNDSSPLRIGPYTSVADNQTSVCYLCHEAENTTIGGTHTGVVTRVCTDRDCHALPADGSVIMVFSKQNISQKLAVGSDAHSGWYNAMNSTDSAYAKANATEGGYYTSGFYACLACHTQIGMSMNISRPQVFNINITVNGTMYVNVSAPVVNDSAMNTSITVKQAWDSMWL